MDLDKYVSSEKLTSKGDRHTKRDWNLNNALQCKFVEDQQKIAEKILGESKRIREQTEERAKANKETTDKYYVERIKDVEFNANELFLQRKEICLELEALGVYKMRLVDSLNSLLENCLKPCSKCISIRENRIGIDLVVDNVEIALHKEMKIILYWQNRMETAINQTEETMRRLRAVQYALDLDSEHKQHSVVIDRECVQLKSSDLLLDKVEHKVPPHSGTIVKSEWENFSAKNLQNANKELSMSRPVRTMVDSFLKQVVEDVQEIYHHTNQAFIHRIAETKKVKERLESMLAETIKKIDAMIDNIDLLQKALEDKKSYLMLANVRLDKRTERPGIEFVKDVVCQSLYKESEMLKMSIGQLQKTIQEAHASLRYLTQIQINLQEDINVKTNSIKIDEVNCMSVRGSMNHFHY